MKETTLTILIALLALALAVGCLAAYGPAVP